MAWMNAETLQRDARRGSHGLLEPQPPGGAGARATRPATASGCARRTTTATATRCCSWSSRRARAPATPVSAPASTARSGLNVIRPEPRRVPRARRATTRSSRSGPSCSPTSRRRSRRSPSSSATAPASCSSRSSTASAGAGSRSSAGDPTATLVARDGHIDGRRATSPPRCPPTEGVLAALEALLARLPVARRCPTCRRCTAGSSATSATTSSARSSTCPTCPATTSACPTRCCP